MKQRRKSFGGWKTVKPYCCVVPQPNKQTKAEGASA
jgi:hypothetical protein